MNLIAYSLIRNGDAGQIGNKSFSVRQKQMDLNQVIATLKGLDSCDPKELPARVLQLKDTIAHYSALDDFQNLGVILFRLSEHIMALKEVKEHLVDYLEQLIDQVIITSISKQFRVGYDALRFIFNSSSEFYKTARADLGLKFPIGVSRPLERYEPAPGEECDVVRPYITSTSFCGWTRCTVFEVDAGKYTLQYVNTAAPTVVRGEVWFAPLGTRTQDFQWRQSLEVGSPVEALLNRVWYKSTVVELGEENGSKRVRITYRRFAQNGDREDTLGCRYFGLGGSEDEWIDLYSTRIQKCGKMANKQLCYYTYNSDQILPQDNYDILFEKEYESKPFHAIMRSLSCKSSCIIRFINTYTSNFGFETLLGMMDKPESPIEIVFSMIANTTCLTPFVPRMDVYRYLPALHDRVYRYFREQVKNLTVGRIDMGYFCIDTVGRRLYSLTQIYRDQNELRKDFINQFLDMNLEKQMLALRYLNDLINPKKPYTTEERAEVDEFLREKRIFSRIFQSNTHEQIISRTHTLLRYMIEKEIVSLKEFEQLWNMVPISDQRSHAIIEKLIADISQYVPLTFVEMLLDKLLALKETELTPENLNLLRELKNRELVDEYQIKILTFLWDVLTTKSFNIKTNIEEEVEKVFKVFISGIKNPNTRMNVMDSMASRLAGAKKIKNEIDILKDFIKSYPEKPTIIEETDAPVSIYDAVTFLKSKKIYETLLSILQNSKNEALTKEILEFLSFLFEYDFDDINPILKPIYEKLGPSDKFLEWVRKILKRARTFVDEILDNTTNFIPFENLSMPGFEAMRDMIFEINEEEGKIKIVKTYDYPTSTVGPATKDQSTETPGPVVPLAPTQERPIGPSLPQTKKHVFVLVSPFNLKGMRFFNHLLLVLKNSRVYDETVKLIIQFIVNLDDSMSEKTEQYRREFLGETMKELGAIVERNEINDKVKQEIQVYIQLFVEIFSETEKEGIGNVSPHFQNIEGEKLNLTIDNTFPRAKGTNFQKFNMVVNENCTLWKFKTMIGEIIKDSPSNIDILKYQNPLNDAYNGKSLSDMFFFDGEGIKIAQRAPRLIPKHSLVSPDGETLSNKFATIVEKWYNEYKNSEGVLRMEDMKRLSDANWRGSLFRQEERLKKMYEEHDKGAKGYLTLEQFKEFFYTKSVKNEHAIWKIINLSGYKNNLKHSSETTESTPLNLQALPRRILSSPEVYALIFKIFENPVFKDVHLNFYRLLSILEVSPQIEKQIEDNIYHIITSSECMYELCYTLEVANSVLSNKGPFFYDFWQKGGVEKILERISKVMALGESVYKLDLQLRNTVLPNMLKILNMYVNPLVADSQKARIISAVRINFNDLEELLKKIKEYKESEQTVAQMAEVKDKLKALRPDFNLSQMEPICLDLMHNLLKNYTTESSDFIPKLTGEIIRLIGFLSVSKECSFDPHSLIYGVTNESMNYRRGCCNIIYLFIEDHEEFCDPVLTQLLKQMPSTNRHIYSNYFILLAKLIENQVTKHKDKNDKDEFFISLANDLLDKLFSQEGESRNSIVGDKIILGILMTFEILINKPEICSALKGRKHEIVEKCLFAYNIKERIEAYEVTPEMLTEPKQGLLFADYVKCKTDETRSLAYSIVDKLHEASKEEDTDFLEKYVLPVFEDLSGDIRITSSKMLNVGLKNFGSTCYMNSMLQVLNSVEPFRNLLMQADVESGLVKQLKEVFAYLFYSERADFAPRKLIEAFVPPINPGIQQDTTQFLNFLFDQVESGLSESDFRRLLDEIFKGENCAQMICHSCGYKKENQEPFFSFGVEIEGKYDLDAALEGSYQGEVIQDYLCDNCANRGETTKRNILSKIPSIFFIHLRRIVFNYDMFVNMKIHTRLQFPDHLNIEPFTKEGVELRESMGIEYMKGLAHNEEESKKFEELALHGKDKDYYKLNLKGIIVHSGSADVGHYYSILPDGKTWHKFDDSRVTIFGQSGFESECYGGNWTTEEWGGFGSSANAYVLVYEKVVKNPIRLSKKVGQMEEEVSLQYKEVKPYNSPEQYKAVWLDNHKFMVELHLLDSSYSKGFMKFASSIMERSVNCNKITLLSRILYTITPHSEMVGDLPKIFSSNVHQITPDILHDFILKDKKQTFKLLFSHARSVRDFMAFYLKTVLFESYRAGDEAVKKEVVDFIHEYLANMTGEVAKNWLRIDGYFRFLELMVVSSVQFPELWHLFKNYNLISTLIDFVMEKNSPVRISPKNYSLGTKTNPMDFTNGLNIISFLLRHSYGFTGQNYEVPTIPENYLFHLNDNDVTCLSFMDFYRKMFKERQNMEALGAIIQRLCILNLDFSRAITEPLLTAIGSITDKNDELQDLSHVVLQVLRIKDDFWKHRFDMMLGWCTPYLTSDNTLSCLDTERFIFTSTIFDIFPVESLLNYAYLYRSNLACFQLLKAIVQACSVSEEATRFLAAQPSLNYVYPSYIHWVRLYMQDFLGFHTIEEKKKERIQKEIEEALKYVDDIISYREAHPDCAYHSLISGKTEERREICRLEKGDIEVVIKEIDTYCLPSEPTGANNLSITPLFEMKQKGTKFSADSNALKIIQKPVKGIALKMQPVQEAEDKELHSLFDNYPDISNQLPQNEPIVLDESEVISVPVEQVPPEPEQPEETVNIEGIFLTPYFREIEIYNRSRKTKVVRIVFKPKENANTLLPEEFSYKVAMKSNESSTIAKQDAAKDWGDIAMEVFEEDFDKNKHDKMAPTSNWYKLYGGREEVMEPAPEEEKVPEKEEKAEGKAEGKAQELELEMNCPICTVLNLRSSITCELCGSDLH